MGLILPLRVLPTAAKARLAEVSSEHHLAFNILSTQVPLRQGLLRRLLARRRREAGAVGERRLAVARGAGARLRHRGPRARQPQHPPAAAPGADEGLPARPRPPPVAHGAARGYLARVPPHVENTHGPLGPRAAGFQAADWPRRAEAAGAGSATAGVLPGGGSATAGVLPGGGSGRSEPRFRAGASCTSASGTGGSRSSTSTSPSGPCTAGGAADRRSCRRTSTTS